MGSEDSLLLYQNIRIMRQQEFPTVKSNKQLLKPNFIPHPHIHSQHAQKYNQSFQQVQNISVNNQKLHHQLSIYDWRCKTQFPIIKISHFKVLQRKVNTTLLEIKKQKHCLKLKNCKQLPLFKVLYLLKESIIGFQRLYNKFGPFMITSSMITINSLQKCKVWLNQNYASNAFIPIKISQSTFLRQLYRLFQEKSNHLKNTIQFYPQLYPCKTFCEALSLIQKFSKENKIIISSSCKLTTKEMIFEETQQNFDFTSSLSISKRPDFLPLTGLRISLNTTSENPFKKTRKPTQGLQSGTQKGYFSILIKNNNTEDTTGQRSYMNSTSNNQDPERNDRHAYFRRQENKETIYKSQLPITVTSPQKHKFFVRKCNSHTVQIKQFERLQFRTEKAVNNFGTALKNRTKTELKSYGNINDEEDEQTTRHNIQNTFEKNQWNKRLNGLLQEQGQLNHSIVNTQQKVKTKMTPIKLELLGKMSNNVYQSFINLESKGCYDLSPQTNQY